MTLPSPLPATWPLAVKLNLIARALYHSEFPPKDYDQLSAEVRHSYIALAARFKTMLDRECRAYRDGVAHV